MESPEGVAAKRRVLVDALTMCLERSKVCAVVDAQTIRSVLASGASEIWREGEFHLEVVWKILCQQPGLSAKEVAPPLLVFKAFEAELGVQVRVPQALSALPRGEQVRLRDELQIGKDDFAQTLAELQRLAAAAQAEEKPAPAARPAPSDPPPPASPSYARPHAARKNPGARRGLALGLSVVALLAVAGALYVSFRDPSSGFDTADVAPLIKLTNARRQGRSLNARIDDPRWNGLTRDRQTQLVGQVFDLESQKGLHVLTLSDGTRVRATASDLTGRRAVLVR